MDLSLIEKIKLLGRRALSPDLATLEERREVGRSPLLQEFREWCAGLARRRQANLHSEMAQVGRENANTEFKACNGFGTLHARIPLGVVEQMKSVYGDRCWQDPDFMESFLRDNPACKVVTRRGTRGQEYRKRMKDEGGRMK